MKTFSELSEQIQLFNNIIIAGIKDGSYCRECPMYGSVPVILDTNVYVPGKVNVKFRGLNPGKDEAKHGVPFIGRAGQLLRQYINPLIAKYNLTYVITNAVLCSSNNKAGIPKISAVIKHCKVLTDIVDVYFPYDIEVLLGADALYSAGLSGQITLVNGQMIEVGKFAMVHPSSILYNRSNEVLFEEAIMRLDNWLHRILVDGDIPY